MKKPLGGEGDVDYDISIQDSRYDHGFNTVWGRVKQAVKTLFGKPIYYNDVYIHDEETFKKFVADMEELAAYGSEQVP